MYSMGQFHKIILTITVEILSAYCNGENLGLSVVNLAMSSYFLVQDSKKSDGQIDEGVSQKIIKP